MRRKETFCATCNKAMHHLGIASHRAMHRRKQEDCTITYANGNTYTHWFGKKKNPGRRKAEIS